MEDKTSSNQGGGSSSDAGGDSSSGGGSGGGGGRRGGGGGIMVLPRTHPRQLRLVNSICNITHYDRRSGITNTILITNISQIINLSQGDNITCSLEYLVELNNASLLISYETGENETRILNSTDKIVSFDITDIPAGCIVVNITVHDQSLNQNSAIINLLVDDIEPPTLLYVIHRPSSLLSLDPGVDITISAKIIDNLRIDKVILYYGSNSTELKLDFGSHNDGIFSTTLNLPKGNYSYYIWAKDSHGNTINSSRLNQRGLLQVWYDYTINLSITNVSEVVAMHQNFTIGTIQINNTGDYRYTCVLDIVSRPSGTMEFYYNNSPVELEPNSIKTGKIGAKGLVPGIVDARIIINCSCIGCREDESNYTTSLILTPTIKIVAAGPYFESYVDYPSSLSYGSKGRLELRLKNIGNEDASNITIQFVNLPEGIEIEGLLTKDLMTGRAVDWQLREYYDIKVASNISTGTYCFDITVSCDNLNLAQKVGEVCLKVEQKKKLVQTEETIDIVRNQREFFLIVKNIFGGPLERVKVNVFGNLSQYVSIEPKSVEIIPVNESYNFTVKIIAPKYFTIGTQYLNFTIEAIINNTSVKGNITTARIINLEEHRLVTLTSHESPKDFAKTNWKKLIVTALTFGGILIFIIHGLRLSRINSKLMRAFYPQHGRQLYGFWYDYYKEYWYDYKLRE